MNIEHIRAFLEVASIGSFQIAAENLSITQSTMSARIKSLEERLNRQLFYRKRNGAALTSGGNQFHPSAVDIVRAWEQGRQLASLPEDLNASVTLGVEENHAPYVLDIWLEAMKDRMSDIATSVCCESSSLLTERLRNGLLDVALVYYPQRYAEITIEELTQEELVLVSTTHRVVDTGAVPGYVMVDWGTAFREQHSNEFPGVFQHKITMRSSAVALAYIMTQGGSAYLMERTARPLIDAGSLFLVEGAPRFLQTIFCAVRNDSLKSKYMTASVEALRSAINSNRQHL